MSKSLPAMLTPNSGLRRASASTAQPGRKDFFSLLESENCTELREHLKTNQPSKLDLAASLKWACLHGNADLIPILVNSGADVNEADQFGGCILHFAVRGGKEAVILALLEHGANFHDWKLDGETLLLWACHNGCVDLIRTLVSVYNQDPTEDVDDSGKRALHVACVNGQTSVVKYLLCSGQMEVNCKDDRGWTSLHYVSSDASSDRGSIIRLLIERGADPLIKTPSGQTALDLAYECGGVKMLSEALSVHSLLELLIASDSVVMQERSAGLGCSLWNQYSGAAGQKTMGSQDSKESFGENGQGFLVTIWRKIFQNDDVELLVKFRDSRIWEKDAEAHEGFQSTKNLTPVQFTELFNDCYENGMGIFSYIQINFSQEIQSNNFRRICQLLTSLTIFDTIELDQCLIFQEPHTTLVFLALITGRFRIMESLLRQRQFDIVPLAILVTLIFRRMQSESSFPKQVLDSLNTIADMTEALSVDAMNRSFIADNSMSKKATLDILDIPLRPFGCHSIIDLADKANCTSFLCLPCCQMVLDERWYGKLSRMSSGWRWLIKLCPPLIMLHNTKKNRKARVSKKDKQQSNPHATLQRRKTYKEASLTYQIGYIKHAFLSPSVKFFYHSLSHFVFLAILSYVALYQFNFDVSFLEFLCVSFVVGYAIEEFRQFILVIMESNAIRYFKDIRNWLDMTAIVLTFNGFITRLYCINNMPNLPKDTEAYDELLYIARVILLTGLLLFYIRILFILSIYRILGPKLKMIGAMLKNDLLPLLSIFAIFLVAFGVVFQGLLYPNGYSYRGPRFTGTETLMHIYRRAFYGMFSADYTAEELSCVIDNTCSTNVGYHLVYYIFNIFYVLIVNIMLVNLLIALFSNTVSRIDQQSTAHWFADRYKMVEEYRERSIFPPPFNMLSVMVEVGRWMAKLCYGCCCHSNLEVQRRDKTLLQLAEILIKFLVIQSFALRSNRDQLGLTTSGTATTGSFRGGSSGTTGNVAGSPPDLDNRLIQVESRLGDISDLMNDLLGVLEKKHLLKTDTAQNLLLRNSGLNNSRASVMNSSRKSKHNTSFRYVVPSDDELADQ